MVRLMKKRKYSPRPITRPIVRTVRLLLPLDERVNDYCRDEQITRTEVIEEALYRFFERVR